MRIARRLALCAALHLLLSAACVSGLWESGDFGGPVAFTTCFYGATEAPDSPGEIWFVFEEQRGIRVSGCYGRIVMLGGPGSNPLRVEQPLAGTITSVDGPILEANISIEQVVDITAMATLDQGDTTSASGDHRRDDLLTVRPEVPGNDHLFSSQPLRSASALLVEGGDVPCPLSCEELDTLINFDRPWPPELEVQP